MRLPLFALWASLAAAQPEAEEAHLGRVLAEAGSSVVEYLRAIEKHLERYPRTARRAELERAAVKAAIETQDRARIQRFGESVLARKSDDAAVLEAVARALLDSDDAERSRRALGYARRLEEVLRSLEKERAEKSRSRARFDEEIARALGRALVFQSRATGNAGRVEDAVALARRSWDTWPTAEAARESARWLTRFGKDEDAVRALADAFTIADPRTTDADRAQDRARMGALYRKLRSSEAGLGDVLLEAWDRNARLIAARQERARAVDPNAGLTDPLEFTLTGVKGDRLAMSTLRGKIVILDFWATWCAPCRVQHPLYEVVQQRFKTRTEVVFVAINTDENRALVAPFLGENGWTKPVYFDDGLSELLRVTSIPTTILFGKRGQVFSRMVGFVPDRFVDMLSERIEQALAE